MLDLTSSDIQELEAEFAKLTPEEQAVLKASVIALERSVESMRKRLDETLEWLDQSFARMRAMDMARDVLGDDFIASRWLMTPNEYFAGKTPMAVIKEQDDPARVVEHLKSLGSARFRP